ncbi:unnamed protein product [Gongylonema pulchrum]|uniref:HpcH_HpaI domain-containing protein n=1 Tax=Gongylonema pulchrum TaxID=637853 RepID=A0A183D4Z4_9BILA|nr:unnamed protein product [Gongylonema pulchrum]
MIHYEFWILLRPRALGASLGAARTKDASENIYARQHFVTCCKAFGLQAIDSVYIDIEDKEGLRQQCEQGRNWGFDGKQTIHPKQVDIVQNAFLPSKERVDWARTLVDKFEEHQKAGRGAFVYRGHMVDRPLLLQAQKIVTLMERINERL